MKQQQTEGQHRITRLAKAAGRHLIPNLGTLLVVGVLLWVQQAGAIARPQSVAPNALPGTITYQGKLTDAAGDPVTGDVDMVFTLYDAPAGGTALWSEAYTGGSAVPVQEGEFTVHLGSVTPFSDTVWQSDALYLGIAVDNDPEMTPREPVSIVPMAMMVSDGSVTTAKLADGAVTQAKAPMLLAANKQDRSVRYGNVVIQPNANGEAKISYAAFPHDTEAFIGINADYKAGTFYVTLSDREPSYVQVKLVNHDGTPRTGLSRLMYIAVGY